MPILLPRDRFEAARAFVREQDRPLEGALLNHALGAGPAEAALVALSAFQNLDGGFGNGLEPDMQGPASTAIATSVALRLLKRLGVPARHPMVIGALGWLDETLDREAGVWPIVGPEVNDAPHAPWWSWSETMVGSDEIAGAKLGFRFNPSAELLGLLYTYRDGARADTIEIAEARLRQTITELSITESAYDILCAVRLAEAEATPRDLIRPLDAFIRRSIAAHDPADEHMPALHIATTPAGAYVDAVADRIEPGLDALIAGQQPDGGWTIFWDWSFVDAKAWAKAKQDSRAWITREALETLTAWGTVEAS